MTTNQKYIAGGVLGLATVLFVVWLFIKTKTKGADPEADAAGDGTPAPAVTPPSQTYTNSGPGNYTPANAVNTTDRAKSIYRAGNGIGTDERAIYSALSGLTTYQLQSLADQFKSLYGESLLGFLQGELDADEMYKVQHTYKLNTVKW